MFRIVDSHAHLNTKDFDKDRDQVIERAFHSGVKAILCPAEVSDRENLRTTYSLLKKYHQISAAAGVHPHNARFFNPKNENIIREMAKKNQITAVGEIGLDYHYNYSQPSEQQYAFQKQLFVAEDLKLPVILHSRMASSDILSSIKEQHFTFGGILHCFTEGLEFAEKMLDLGFYISFSGIITYPKAHQLREAAKNIPLQRLLIETDAPYLTPVPYRNKYKRNEPAFVIETAKILAELKKVSFESFAEQMYLNFSTLFQFEI